MQQQLCTIEYQNWLQWCNSIQLFHISFLRRNPIFLITKTKYIWVYDYSFCCWDACRNIQVQEKKVCISLKFIILKIKDPWLILINCQTCHFNFFYRVDPVFSFSFVKSIKIGSFPRFGYPKIRRGRDACSEEVLYHIAAQQVPGFGDWQRSLCRRYDQGDRLRNNDCMHTCHTKAKCIYTYAG